MDLFELNGRVVVNLADALKAFDEINKEGQKSQSKLSKAFSAVGKGALAVGKTVMTGLAAGGAAMGALTIKALNLSGELEQNMGGSEAVFKEYAGKMQETAKNAFQNMGLSTSDFLGTANKMGALFQGAGFSIEESSNLASDAMQRAADVASIMGISTDEAMEAIAGAAKGNFTMMDNLGVAMNDTTLQAYALSKGIDKSTQEMTNQEKIGLAMEMFMEKTAYAAGNYAKENETLAGSLGTAKAALTNFLDGSGDVDQLVTAFSNAANVIIKNVGEIAPRLINGITDIVNQVVPMLPPLLNQLLPVIIEGAVSLINGLVAALPSIISALMAALPALIDGIVQIVNALIQALPQIIEALVAALPALIPQLINGLVSMIVILCANFSQIIQPILDILPDLIVSICDALLANLPALLDGILALIVAIAQATPSLWGALWEALKGVFTSLLTNLGVWFQPVADWFKSVWDGFVNIVSGVWDAIKNAISIAIQFIASILDAAFQIITLPFRFIWENCKDTIMSVWETIKNAVSTAIDAVWNVISTVFNAIKDFITPVWNGIRDTISNVWNSIKTSVSTAINAVKSTVSNVFNSIKSTVSNIFNSVKSTVTNVWNGIMNAIKKPIEKARDLVKGAIDKIKGFFNFNFTWPKLKMPHFGISPSGWKIGDLLQGSIPKLKIDWYAEGGVMKRPTLFDYNPATGTAKVGGEKGAEAVAPIDTLQQYIQAAVAGQNSGMMELLERIIDLLVQFFPDALDAMRTPMVCDTNGLAIAMAPTMDVELGKIAIKKGRGR